MRMSPRRIPAVTTAEVAWLAKRYSSEVPTRHGGRDIASLFRRGLISQVFRPSNYWEAPTISEIPRRRPLAFCTFCTPLGRYVVDEHRRASRARRQAGGMSLSEPPWGPRRPHPGDSASEGVGRRERL